jgi:hypothetical protein
VSPGHEVKWPLWTALKKVEGTEESGGYWAVRASVQESGSVLFGADVADGAVCLALGGVGRFYVGWCLWCQWDMPKAIGCVAFADDDDLVVLVYFDIVLGEQGDAVVVA